MLGKRAYESAQIRHFECLSSETWYHVQIRPIFQKIHKKGATKHMRPNYF